MTGKAILLSPLGFAGLGLFVYADANDVEGYVPGNKVTASMGIGSLYLTPARCSIFGAAL